MKALQITTIVALALNAANVALLLSTASSPGQDAAGRGMATGFVGMSITAIVVTGTLLALGYWLDASWLVVVALVIAILPILITVLPVLL